MEGDEEEWQRDREEKDRKGERQRPYEFEAAHK